jgi:hypothetical protein
VVSSARQNAILWQIRQNPHMKIILPSLLIIGLTAGGDALGQAGIAAVDRQFQLPADPATAPLSSSQAAAGGDLMILQAADRLAKCRSISARVRYRVELFGHELVGEGIYVQQGTGAGQQLRLELKTLIGERVAVFLQVCDGKYLWQYQDSEAKQSDAAQKPQVTRVDLHRVRQAIASNAAEQLNRPTISPATDLAFGGLPKLLDGLKHSFTFRQVEADRLDQLPAWVTTGTWRPETLAVVSKELSDQAAAGQPLDVRRLPLQMPESVRVFVGQDDLFPYRIEYLRRIAKSDRAGEASAPQPIVTVEFYEVSKDTPIAPGYFNYQPGNADVLDTTQTFMKTLGLK